MHVMRKYEKKNHLYHLQIYVESLRGVIYVDLKFIH